MAERKCRGCIVFIDEDDKEFNPSVDPIVEGIESTVDEFVQRGMYQISDFGSNPRDLISNIIDPVYENAGLPVDVSDLNVDSLVSNVIQPGSAEPKDLVGFKDPLDM